MLPQSPNQLPDYPITQLPNSPAPLPDCRPPQSIGRSARLELRFERRGARTVLAHAYAEPPFRVGGAFDLDGAARHPRHLGPRIFGGDSLRQSVHVGPGARSPIAIGAADPSRASRPSCPPALLHHHYCVDEDAELLCQWDPVIRSPARVWTSGSTSSSRRAAVCWTDALMAGRVSRGKSGNSRRSRTSCVCASARPSLTWNAIA